MPKRRLFILITDLATLTVAVAVLALGIIRKWQLDTSSQELAIALTQSALTSNPAILRENGSTEWQQSGTAFYSQPNSTDCKLYTGSGIRQHRSRCQHRVTHAGWQLADHQIHC